MAPVLVKSLSRLSRSSLIDLALKWLRQTSQSHPYLACNRTINESEEEDYLFTPADDVAELKEIYHSLQQEEREMSKGNIVDRIVDGDWRRGLSLHQLAMVDLAYLEQNDTALRWTALRLVPIDNEHTTADSADEPPKKKRRKLHHSVAEYPTISPTTFVAALKSEISPLVKAHYHLHLLPAPYNLPILRLYISPHTAYAPRKTSIPRPTRHAVDSGRIIYIALPPSCPHIYVSLSGSSARSASTNNSNKLTQPKIDIASMKRIILEAIPKALSRPHERWALAPTKLTTKSLKSICQLRGNTRPGTSGGAYSKFVAGKDEDGMNKSPIDIVPVQTDTHARTQSSPASIATIATTVTKPTPPPSSTNGPKPTITISQRFGSLPQNHHSYAPLDKFTVTITDLLHHTDPANSTSARPSTEAAPITIRFTGTDVFRGVKALAELDAITSENRGEKGDRVVGVEDGHRDGSGTGNTRKRRRVINDDNASNVGSLERAEGRTVDLSKLPSWMTGEMGVSVLTV